MIWHVYRLEDEKPAARVVAFGYSSAEHKAFRRFGRSVMVISRADDVLRRRAQKVALEAGRIPYKGGKVVAGKVSGTQVKGRTD